jgi:hypothetical protein
MEQGKFNFHNILKIKLIIFFILLVNINSICQTRSNIKKPKDERLAEAYGYLQGQKFTLDKIQSNYSDLSLLVIKARNDFSSSFGNAEKNLIQYLTKHWGEKNFSDFEITIKNKISETIANQKFDEEDARSFVNEVQNRAYGEISTPVLETLLHFQHLENPENEFINGYKQIFKTKGHAKSKGTDWQIKVPKSWLAEEAERPNIIQKFTSNYGDGSEIILIMIKDMGLPQNYKLPEKELNTIFSEKGTKEILPKGSKFISFKKMILDNNNGGMLIFDQIVERLDTKTQIRMIQFYFIRSGKMYFIQCSVKTSDLSEDLTNRANIFMPLFRQVANSLVINEQYR